MSVPQVRGSRSMLFGVLAAVAACAFGVSAVSAFGVNVSAAPPGLQDPDAKHSAPALQPKVTSDKTIKPFASPTHGRKIGWPKILRAIYLEGNEWAAYYESLRGYDHWFEIEDGSCSWIRVGKSGVCGGYIVEWMPEECAFAGRAPAARSYEHVRVPARKIPGRRAASATLINTFDYYYCYN